MNLYILNHRPGVTLESPYDVAYQFIIQATSEESARKLAQEKGGDECFEDQPFWVDSSKTDCQILEIGSEQKVICCDFLAG